MKSAVFYFTKSLPEEASREIDYSPVYAAGAIQRFGYVRIAIINGPYVRADDNANVRPGETVLNSVLLEE